MVLKTKMISRFLKLFFIIDLAVVLFCLLSGNTTWLLNTQVAFFSSLFVTIGSYMGYKKNISKRVETHVNDDDDYDELDKMDDRFDLYSPQVEQNEEKEYTKEEIKEEIAKSKESLKKNNTKNLVGSAGAMASMYRLAGYIALVVGFFYLNNNGYLHIYSYILGFLIVPLSTLVISFISKLK